MEDLSKNSAAGSSDNLEVQNVTFCKTLDSEITREHDYGQDCVKCNGFQNEEKAIMTAQIISESKRESHQHDIELEKEAAMGKNGVKDEVIEKSNPDDKIDFSSSLGHQANIRTGNKTEQPVISSACPTSRTTSVSVTQASEDPMMDLSSANSIFMQAKPNYIEPLYTSKQLPKYLQDSLTESLSKITIQDKKDSDEQEIQFCDYSSEAQLPDLTELITKDLSEPYSIYTYRYFLHNWPHLSFLAYCTGCCVGAIVCKLDQHRKDVWRGYIAMLVVHKDYRRHKIGTKLVQKAIRRMIEQGCDEIVLETEVTNQAALQLYENLGFVRDKRLLRYYLNGVDAWRLKLWLL